MFEYSKIKAEIEQVKCPLHGKSATVTFVDGKVNLENVCCDEHNKKLNEMLPEIEDRPDAADILQDVF
jgi:prepilin-type processing-associated H-X9-DG protein